MNFHETAMGKRFFESSVPKLIKELDKLNENLRPKEMEYTVADANNIGDFLYFGWRPVLTFNDKGLDCIIVEREVRHDK